MHMQDKLLLLPFPPMLAPPFITFLKIGDWSDSRTHKTCRDVRWPQSSLSVYPLKNTRVAVNLPLDADRHLFISWKSSPSLNWKVTPGCCVEALNHSALHICSTRPFDCHKNKNKTLWLEPRRAVNGKRMLAGGGIHLQHLVHQESPAAGLRKERWAAGSSQVCGAVGVI